MGAPNNKLIGPPKKETYKEGHQNHGGGKKKTYNPGKKKRRTNPQTYEKKKGRKNHRGGKNPQPYRLKQNPCGAWPDGGGETHRSLHNHKVSFIGVNTRTVGQRHTRRATTKNTGVEKGTPPTPS